MRSPHPRAALALATLTLGAACASFRPAPAPVRPTNAAVRLTFAAPRVLRAVGRAGDTLVWPRVAAVAGRVTAVRGDTLDLAVRWVRDAGGRARDWTRDPRRAPALALVPAAGDRVEARRFDARKTAAGVLVAAGAVTAAYLLLLFVAFGLSGGGAGT